MHVLCSWRPKWKYCHWSSALAGFIACAAMNFVIVWYWTLAAMVFLLVMYVYIDYRQVPFFYLIITQFTITLCRYAFYMLLHFKEEMKCSKK